MTDLDNAYQAWLEENPAQRYGSMHRATFEAGWNAAIDAAAQEVETHFARRFILESKK